MITQTKIRRLAVAMWIGVVGSYTGRALADGPSVTWKAGDKVPEAKMLSIEGIPVSLRPPEGKLLLVLVEDFKPENATERTKAAITLYRRFHGKGLNAVCLSPGASESTVWRSAFRWQIPWPIVTATADGEKPASQFAGLSVPASYVVDEQGKVVAVGLEGEKAHETIAKLLKLSLDALPMPEEPKARKEEDSRITFDAVIAQQALTDASTYAAAIGTAKERAAAEPCKDNLRQISIALTDYREEHNGELPKHLSDLYPTHLQDEKLLLCPRNPDMPEGFGDYADPKMKCSYLYEFAPEPSPRKEGQLKVYGDRVPVVRCLHHDRPMSLSYGGEIYFSDLSWENNEPEGQALECKEARVRHQLRIIGSALAKYRRDKGDMPNELADLRPDYLKDESQLTCPVTNKAFNYRFSPEAGGGRQGRELKLQEAKDPNYGMYVPVIRVKGVWENGDVINLGYGGEIYRSRDRWEELFQ